MKAKSAHSKRRLRKGKPVDDAVVDLLVTVQDRDIKNSAKRSAAGCAAAVAICRQYKATAAEVYLSRAYVLRSDRWLRYTTPSALRTEIVCFDRTGIFGADDYRLKAPGKSERLDYKPVRNPPTGKRGTGKGPRPQHFVVGVRDHAPKGHVGR